MSGAWGQTQEAAALHALLPLLEPGGARLEEAGLFWLEPAELEAAYGLPPGSLPPLGASPDALLRRAPSPPPQAPCACGPAAPAAVAAADSGFVTSVRANAAPASQSAQACVPGPAAGMGWASSGGCLPAEHTRLLGEPGACGAAGLRPPGLGLGLGAALEPVEVKSTCPFRLRSRVSRKGCQTRAYAVADRGPLQEVRLPVPIMALPTVCSRVSVSCVSCLQQVHLLRWFVYLPPMHDSCTTDLLQARPEPVHWRHVRGAGIEIRRYTGVAAVRAAAAAGMPCHRREQRTALQPLRHQGAQCAVSSSTSCT